MRQTDRVPLPDRLAGRPRDTRGYPLIAVVPRLQVRDRAGEVDFGALSSARMLAVATFDVCAVCATPFGADELRWQVVHGPDESVLAASHLDVDGLDTVVFGEAPVHEICALYSSQVCPFVSSPYARFGDAVRRGQRREHTLMLAGFSRTVRAFCRPADQEHGQYAMGYAMAGLAARHTLSTAGDAAAVYADALAADPAPDLPDSDRQVSDLFWRKPGDKPDGFPLAEAVGEIGAIFCPKLNRLADVQHLLRDRRIVQNVRRHALRLHADPQLAAQEREHAPTLESRVAAAWTIERRGNLPEPLTAWLADGLHAELDRQTAIAARRPADPGAAERRRKMEKARRHRRR